MSLALTHEGVSTPAAGRSPDQRVNDIMNRMALRMREAPSLRDLARAAGLSIRQTQRLFRSHLGMTPGAVWKSLRMQKAGELSAACGMSVKQIAAECGFRDVGHFIKELQATYMTSPSKYRSSINGHE